MMMYSSIHEDSVAQRIVGNGMRYLLRSVLMGIPLLTLTIRVMR
jgi:hypothetical protein